MNLNKFKNATAKTIFYIALALFSASTSFSQFTPGNLTVLQVGNGVNTLTNTGNAVIIKEYSTTSPFPTYSVVVPTSGANALINSGTASSEGGLSLSNNGQYLVFGGYNIASTNTVPVAGSASTLIPRGIAIVSASGTYSLAATSNTFYNTNNIRSAAADGIGNFWGAGANQGTNYFGNTNTPTTIQNSITNTRCIYSKGSNLLFSTGSSTPGIYSTPAAFTSGGSVTPLILTAGTGIGNASPYAFYSNPAQTIMYIADDRSPANGGGIQKWLNNSGTWTYTYTIPTGTAGARGVIASFTGSVPVIYAITADATISQLVRINDVGATSTVLALHFSPPNTLFRGIAFSPTNCVVPTVTVTATTPVCSASPLVLNSNTSGTGPFTYTWTGAGVFSSNSVSNPTVTGAISNSYTVTVANACGSTTGTVNFSITPTPSITITSTSNSVCLGNSSVLTATGAATYTWNTGATTSTLNVTPTITTVYSVVAAVGSCTASSTRTIVVTPSPSVTITASSNSVCLGNSSVLTATGAAFYTWNTGANTPTLNVTPTITTVYSVVAGVGSCTTSSTRTIVVTPSPSVTITASSNSVCLGSSSILTATGAATYTWNTGATTSTLNVTPTITTVYSVVAGVGSCTTSSTKTIVVNPSPSVTITASSNSICIGNSSVLTATGAATYTWNTGAATPTLNVTPTITTVYLVVAAVGSCTASSTRTIVVTPSPSVTITASSNSVCLGNSSVLTATGAAFYTWNTGANTPTLNVTPTITTVYSVVAGVGSCTTSSTKTIVVNPSPSVTITASSNSVCLGSSSILTATGAATYTWNTGAATPTLNVTPTITTVYSVVAAVGSCSATASKTIVVNPSPSVTITASSNPVCLGNSSVLTATGAATYTWNTGASTPTLNITPTITTVYSVIAAVGTCTTASTNTVVVNPSPNVTITATSNTVCLGNSSVLTATGATTYTWNTGATTPTLNVTPTITTVYSVFAAVGSCSATALKTIVVNTLPTVTVTATTPVCSASPLVLNANTSGTSPFNYTWTGAGVFSSNSVSNPTVTGAISNSYTVTVANTCGSTTGIVNFSITPTPSVTITASSNSVCLGNSSILTATGAATYTWNTGATTPTLNVTPTITTVYSVVATVGSCSATSSNTIVVNSLPIITVNSPSICIGNSTTLTANGASSYTWSNGFVGANAVVSPTITSNYTVTGVSAQGCINTNTTTVKVETCDVGIKEIASATALKFYPNPIKDFLNISFEVQVNNRIISIIDAVGKVVYSAEATKNLSINLSTLSQGIYVLKVKSDSEVRNYKLIKN